MNKDIIVGVDLDDTVYPFVAPLLEKYNKAYQDNLTTEDITNYKISQFLKPECHNIFKEFANKEFFKCITFDPKVVKALTELNEEYTLYFVTAGAPITVRDRDKMLARNLDWYTSSQLVICRDKSLLKLDYLIDDCYANCYKGDYMGIMVKQPWNIKTPYNSAFRINHFTEVCHKIKEIEEAKISNDAFYSFLHNSLPSL